MSEAKSFDPIPEGMYLCSIEKAKPKSTRKGQAMLNVCYNVEDGDYTGQKIFTNVMLEGAGAGFGAALLKAVKIDPTEDFEPDDLIGKELMVTVGIKIREDNGEPQNEVKKVAPIVRRKK